MDSMDCPFCGDKEPGRVVCGNDLAFCLVNIEPLKDGHVMVIPRRHVTRLSEMTQEEAKAVNILTDQMVDLLLREFGENPAIHTNSGGHKTQPHVHVHVLPAKGALRDHFVAHENLPFRVRKSLEEVAAMATRLREALNGPRP